MRPIKLVMQAFGPYAGKETIDFSVLGNRTMFVISGKTGSGKTTIFDGISYAIYGKASGEDRNGPELRSQFASDDLMTEVSLEFNLRRKRYYIWRSPQQNKKKERGEGYTLINAKAELYEFDDAGNKNLLAANVRDVDERIKEIMQIDSNQFRQILMIPQGEFRKLLTSESKDKELILQRLFHTEIYKRVEEKLKEEAADLKRTVEKQMDERNMAIRGIQILENEELKSLLEAESVNDHLILPLLKDEITSMDDKLNLIKQEGAKKQAERDQLQQNIYDAEIIVKQLKTKDELSVKMIDLKSQKELFDQKESEVVLGQKAALLAKQEEICHHLKGELDQATKNSEDMQIRVEKLTKLFVEHGKQLDDEKAREPERERAADTVKRLQMIKEDVYSFANLESLVKKLEKKLTDLKTELQKAEADFNKTDEDLKKQQEEKLTIEHSKLTFLENKRKLELLEIDLEELTTYEGLLVRYQESMTELNSRKQFYENCQNRLIDSKAVVAELEQKWLHSQAAILASQLHDGAACPVCGSSEHPSPAISENGSVPTQNDIKAAKMDVNKLEAEKGKAESAFYESQSAQNTICASLNDLKNKIITKRPDFTDEELEPVKGMIQEERKKVSIFQKELTDRIKKLEAINHQIEVSEKQKLKLNEQRQQLAADIHEVTVQFTEKRTTLNRMVGQIPEELRTIGAYENHVVVALENQKTLEYRFEKVNKQYQETRENLATEKAKLETVEEQMAETTQKLDVEREAFIGKLSEQGFEKYSHYEKSKRTEEQLQNLQEMVRAYREELRSVSDRYNELAQLLKDVKEPDLESLKRAFEEINSQLTLLRDEYTNLLMKKRANEEILEKVEQLNQELKELEERFKLIGHLSEIAKGQNTYRITFERYVLAAFLDDILAQANVRLTKMTSGRYQLLRKTDRSKGTTQSGLELLVFDQYTGQERHVKTLSGGESFKAALSLALGLAEVVQEHAGGVSLETMFIDEGFGTLDPESLDQAIEALIDIQSSGRLVGIISHVPELKERIDARLEVYATQTGSRTEFELVN
jgi:DNA repair protein SbcC/Rad50